jgi:hypothetical protein
VYWINERYQYVVLPTHICAQRTDAIPVDKIRIEWTYSYIVAC